MAAFQVLNKLTPWFSQYPELEGVKLPGKTSFDDKARDDKARDGMELHGYMCVIGGSYGGYFAMTASVQTPEMFKCFVSIAGISDLVVMVQGEDRIADVDSNEHIVIGDPDDPDDLKSMQEHSRQSTPS